MPVIQKTLDYRAKRIIVKIDNVDKSNLINFESLEVQNNLYSKADACYFTYEKFGSRTYVPAGGDEVGVWDRGIKIFGGKITNVKVRIEGKVLVYDVECKDWVDQLDGELVTETYENQTVNAIIADLKSKYATTFDITNVSCTTVIEAIYFDLKPMSKCLDELAEITGYHWYVDPSKKIYFFVEGSITSPFDITDDNGKCLTQSLEIAEDYEQIKNRVNILGGSIANIQVHNQASIDAYGEHEVVIRDDTLTSIDEATQKANAILAAFKDPIKNGNFKTYDAGLVAGQRININSTLRGVNQDFIIESVRLRARTPTDFTYDVKVMTQQDQGLIDLFQQEIMKPSAAITFGNRDFVCDVKFSIVNYHKIEWDAGVIEMSDGKTYNIAAGDREFTNAEVCYFKPSTSETVLQFSTTLADGIGDDRIALGYAIPNPNTAEGAQFIPIGFMGGVRFWGGENIVARTIIAGQIAFDSISGDEISIQTKLAIHDRTFGNKGIQLDYNAGTPRAYIGDGANKFFKYDGVNISWKAQNTELTTGGNLIMIGGSITAAEIKTAPVDTFRLEMRKSGETYHPDELVWVSQTNLDMAYIAGTIAGDLVLASQNSVSSISLFAGASAIDIEGHLYPTANYDLGKPTSKWQHIHLSGNIYVDGNVDGVNISAHVVSSTAHSQIRYISKITIDVDKDWSIKDITNLKYIKFNSTYGKIYHGTTEILDFYATKLACKKPFGFEVRAGPPGAASAFTGYMYYDTNETDLVFSNGVDWYKVTAEII